MWIGRAIGSLEAVAPAPERRLNLAYGLASTAGLVSLSTVAATIVDRVLRRWPPPLRILTSALLLKPAFSLRMLCTAADAVRVSLEANDLIAARERLGSLVSRDTEELTHAECAAAAIESLAENTTDSIVGPMLAYACFGLPGAWAFRTLNTLDSRWGYRGRYDLLGRAAARLDDLTCFVPARLSAILLIAGAGATSGSASGAWSTALREHSRTESPNAGWTMGAMAGGLRRVLAKDGHYLLNGEGGLCTAGDIRRAERVVLAAVGLGLVGPIIAAFLSGTRRLSAEYTG